MKQQVDNFSPRVVVYSAHDISSTVVQEDLQRTYHGSIDKDFLFLEYKGDHLITVEKILESVLEVFKVVTIFRSYDRSKLEGFQVGTEYWFASLGVEYLRDTIEVGLTPATTGDEEASPGQGDKRIKGIKVASMFESEHNPMSELVDLLEEFGFVRQAADEGIKFTSITLATPGAHQPVDFRDGRFSSLLVEEIEENYNSDTIGQVKELLELLKTADHGVILLHGPVGTGKTYLVRALLSELREERVGVLCTPPLQFLQQSGLLTYAATAFSKSLIVLEDLGDLLEEDSASRHINENSNLLNLTEGLMSLFANTILLLSFNYEIGKVNPAITRPGRCLAEIFVGLIDRERASKVAGVELEPRTDGYSLAEAYDARNRMKVVGSGMTTRKTALGLKPR